MKRLLSLSLACLLLVLPLLSFATCQKTPSEEEQKIIDAFALAATMNNDTSDYDLLDPCTSPYYKYKFENYVVFTPETDASLLPINTSALPHINLFPYSMGTFGYIDYYWCSAREVAEYQLGYLNSPQMLYALGKRITLVQKHDFSYVTGDETPYIVSLLTTDPMRGYWGVSPHAMLEPSLAILEEHGFKEGRTKEYIYVAARSKDSEVYDYVDYMIYSTETYTVESAYAEYLDWHGREYATDDYIIDVITDYWIELHNGSVTVKLRYNKDGMITHMETSVYVPHPPLEPGIVF